MNEPRIPFQAPTMPASEAIDLYFSKSRGERYFSNGGPCAQLLEERIAERVGSRHAIVVNNATTGLIVSARAAFARRRRDGFVILPSFTFAATVTAVLWAGYEPLFCDVDAANLHMEPNCLGTLLRNYGGSVAGVLACSTFGVAPPAETSAAWESLCESSGVPLLVDSAAGFGSLFPSGKPLGNQGMAEVFSFHATKPFAMGEGGAVTTNDDELAAEIRMLINFGFDASRSVAGLPGINGKIPEILCAIGLAVNDGFDSVLATRRRLAARMVRGLTGSGALSQANLLDAAVQFVPIVVEADRRPHVLAALEGARIQVRTYFDPALHQMPAFCRYPHGSLSTTDDLTRRVVSLPFANEMSDEHADEVVDTVCRVLAGS